VKTEESSCVVPLFTLRRRLKSRGASEEQIQVFTDRNTQVHESVGKSLQRINSKGQTALNDFALLK
jgi:hypothetical protein